MGAVQKQQIWKSMGGVSGDKMASSSMCEFTMLTLGPDFSAITYFIQPGSTWERLMEMTQRATPSLAMCAQQRLVSVHSSLTIDHTSQNPKDLGPLSLGKHIHHI